MVGDTRAEIEAALGDGSRFGAKITYIEQDAPRGLAHAVLISEPFLKGEPFVMYLGDNLIADGITALVDEYRKLGCNSQILLAKVPNPSQFGVAELENGRVVRLTEKPKEPKSDLALVGVYMFDDTIFEAVKAIRPSARAASSRSPTRSSGWSTTARASTRTSSPAGGRTPARSRTCSRPTGSSSTRSRRAASRASDDGCQVEGKVVIEPGAKLSNCTVRGPAIIGPGAEIRDAFVGPYTSIGAGCLHRALRDRELDRPRGLRGSSGFRCRIADSLIGKNVRIHPGAERPRVHRFLVGDNSEIGIV